MKYCTVCKNKFDDSVSFCPTDGEVLEDDPSSIVGTVLDGQYNIESLLGKGGMGAVYLARHILLGDRVAIKILPPEVRNNAEWLRRFRREGQAARRFRHANAVTVYDLRTASDGTIYMVMEYVEGHTLDAELKSRGRFTAAEALEVLEPIMSVLNTAHSMGVVHRDLKPENIMIGKATTGGDNQIKLLDLGIAKMREIAGVESAGTTELTMAGQVLGTPYYMSPEQWGEISRDGNPEVDGRTDIYSLGLVAYQMISGQRAYSAATLHELRRDHISVIPPPLSEKIPDVPHAFSDAIARAISKDRNDRQSTAGEFSAQLQAGLGDTGQGQQARPYADIPRGGSPQANTHGAPGGVGTKSDVNAATVLTVDAVPTSAPNVPRPIVPVTPEQPAQSSNAADLSSSVTIQQQPRPAVDQGKPRVLVDLDAPKKSRGKPLVFVGAGVLILILLVVAVGGFFVVRWLRTEPTDHPTTTTGKTGTGTTEKAPAAEFGKYWLEVTPNPLVEPERVTGGVPLTSGEDFKFHLEFGDAGYIYIVGPGEGNQLTAFLTDKPAKISGLKTNQIAKGSDFSFPNGIERWLRMDTKPGTDIYTIIFSKTRLAGPAFLGSQATGEPLSETEQAELSEFLAKNKTTDLVTEVKNEGATEPFVAVKVPPASLQDAAPIIFEVRIEHK